MTFYHREKSLPCVAYYSYPWNRKTWQNLGPEAPDRMQTPLPHLGLWDPCSWFPAIYWLQEEASAFNSTLVLFPPSPQTFPFEVVMLGITDFTLSLPFPELPSSFLGSTSLLQCEKAQFVITTHVIPNQVTTTWSELLQYYDSYTWCYSHD